MTSSPTPAETPTATAVAGSTQLFADRFHTGIRFAALGLLVLVAFGVYSLALRVISVFTPVGGIGYIVLGVLAVIASYPFLALVERYLLRFWPSGRSAQLAPAELLWQEKAQTLRFDLRKTMNFWRWRFEIKRRRSGRIPAGHHCFALRLVQDEAVVSLYAFIPPKQADAIYQRFPFYELRREKETGKLPLGGRDPMYLSAEQARWDNGAELEAADFETLLNHLANHLPDFTKAATS